MGSRGCVLLSAVHWAHRVTSICCLSRSPQPQAAASQAATPTFSQGTQGISEPKGADVKDWSTVSPGVCTKQVAGIVSPNPLHQHTSDRAGEEDGQVTANKPPAAALRQGHLSARHSPNGSHRPSPFSTAQPNKLLHSSGSARTRGRSAQESRPAWTERKLLYPRCGYPGHP